MLDYLSRLFDTSDFAPPWQSGHWTPGLAWMHIIANLAVWAAFTAIPLVLAFFILRRRRIIPFPKVGWLFVAFIFAAGATHLVDAVMFYWPAYRVDGAVKMITAAISWAAVLALVRLVPAALSLKSQEELEREVENRSRQARESEAHTRAVFEASAGGIFTYDPRGLIERENPACEAMFGYPRGALAGQDVRTLLGPTDEAPTASLFRPGRYLALGRRHDGTTFPIRLSVSEMINGRHMFVANADDLSDIRRAEVDRLNLEAKIQQVQKLESLGVLAGGIAHDFNNLLVAILGNADLAYHELPRTSPAWESIEQIRTAATRAADLCRQMLAYSGRGRFVIKPFNLSRLVEDMAHLLEASIPKRALLNYDFPTNVPTVEGDMTQVRQVALNLITNAADAIGERGGVISIRTGWMQADRAYLASTYLAGDLAEGCYVYLEVSDTGCGMDEATQARIFDPFFTTKETGRGLGLAAVLGIVRGHKGAIQVYSQKDKGTSVKVLLPAADQPAPLEDQSSRYGEPWEGSGGVLVIDDDPGVLAVACRMLRSAGFTVFAAASGREGVERFRELGDQVRLVLLDLTMPDMDGEQVFHEIRRIRPGARVVLSSGYNEQEVTSRFAGKGLAGFVSKPYRLRELIDTIRGVLEGTANGSPG
jgi:PAS domain S-box-containing protein